MFKSSSFWNCNGIVGCYSGCDVVVGFFVKTGF